MKLISLAMLIGLIGLAVDAQVPPQPDLSGTWNYVAANSPFKDRVLVITQTGDEIRLVESYLFENNQYIHRLTLYTDGRGETNQKQFPDGEPPGDVISKTSWKKGKLFITLRYTYMMQSRGMRYKVAVEEEQTWNLSKDGESLTVNIKSLRDAPAIAPIPVPTTGKSIYRRKH